MHRESWLNAMAEAILPMFTEAGIPVRSKVSIISAIDVRDSTPLGKCFPVNRDNLTQILISPRLKTPAQAASTIVHELVHAAVGCEHGHEEPFRRGALSVGLTEPMPYAPAGRKLAKRLKLLAAMVGPYPKVEIIEADIHHLPAILEYAASRDSRRQQAALITEARTLIKQAASVTHSAVRERRMYHRQTRECRIVHSDAEVAALGSSWWEWIPR